MSIRNYHVTRGYSNRLEKIMVPIIGIAFVLSMVIKAPSLFIFLVITLLIAAAFKSYKKEFK